MSNPNEHDTCVHELYVNCRRFFLVGTAHVSKSSVDLVERVIREQRPTAVAIELCNSRYSAIIDPESWRHADIFNIIKSGKAYVLMAQLALASFQKKLGERLNSKPGDEMRKAIEVTNETGANLVLADRDVKITLKRAWSKASLWAIFKICFSMLASFFSDEELSEEDIEKLKQTDALENAIAEFSSHLPGVKEALIDERDLYLANKIFNAPGDKVVAVLGAGHIPGIKKALGSHIDIEPLEVIPPPRLSFKLFTWSIPTILIGLVAYGFFHAGAQVSAQMVITWCLATGVLAAIGALVALAHPLTIASAFFAAPLTTLHPVIAAGWVCGLVEAVVRKPRVIDLENLADSITSVRKLWSNRVSRILLVVIFANLGASIGTFVAFGSIWSLL